MKGLCMTTTKTPNSARIASLQQAIASGDTGALATFWQEITEKGAPLIEPIEGYEVHYSEFNGEHTYICWRGSLADGLLALIGKGPET
jgi:enterochelin esterase-like enzyme